MTLAPETRALLTDALRPPDGFRVEAAVATTYSLDLTALLLAPMSFAVYDEGTDIERVDPIGLLEAVRRHADHTTVFCQAGSIHVPTSYRPVLAYIEDSVVAVKAPMPGRRFHPKVWVVRFVDADGAFTHRCLVLSRNLTFDRSWDTLLRLDQLAEGLEGGIDGAPLGRFVADLPGLALGPLPESRRGEVLSVASTVGVVRFALPEDFRAGELLPLGLPWCTPLTLETYDHLLAISPFLDVATTKSLATESVILLSRAETFDSVKGALGSARAFVLQAQAEAPVDAEAVAVADESDEHVVPSDMPLEGLHAKTYVAEFGDDAVVVTGSANATRAGFDGNVEFAVRLVGPRGVCGIASVWDGTAGAPGLSRLTQPYLPAEESAEVAERRANEWKIEEFHAELASAMVQLEISPRDGERFELELRLGGAVHLDGASSTVRPVSLPAYVDSRELATPVLWGPLGILSITPFIAVTTSLGVGAARVTRSAVLTAELLGDVPERKQQVLRDVLRNKHDVLRYLAFLLGDPALDALVAHAGGARAQWGSGLGGTNIDIALFEPMIRAVARGDQSLDRVAALLDDLTSAAGGWDLLPEGFPELWSAVVDARGEGVSS